MMILFKHRYTLLLLLLRAFSVILSAEHALSLGNAEDSHQKLRGRRVQSFQQLVISYSKDETTFDIAEKGEVGNDQEDEDDNPVFEENISENNTDKLIVSEEGNDDFEFIIGGENVRPGEYPFFVEWERGCGGSLIAPDLVLSAGHCHSNRIRWNTVWVGGIETRQGLERKVVASQRHPQYDDYSLAYDFLVLRLNSAVPDTYQPVVLNTKPNNYREPVDNEQLTVIGMGVTDVKHNTISDFLLATNVNYIADCERESKYENGDVQEDIMFCAGHPKGDTDSCQGDSGGPIMDAEKRQIGIVSFGEGCAEKNYPGVYARVSAVSSWLEHAMCMSLSHKPSDCSVLRLDLTYDGYPDETGWTLYDTEGNTLYESKAGSVRRTGQRSTLLNVRQGRSYHLRFTDTMGDGFCCKYGEGRIRLSSPNKNSWSSLAYFGENLDVYFNLTEDSSVLVTSISSDDSPYGFPSASPSLSAAPSSSPTEMPPPSQSPSTSPSIMPSTLPSDMPSTYPSTLPTASPSSQPSNPIPSMTPSDIPSFTPSESPTTLWPTKRPSAYPSSTPSAMPSSLPLAFPTHSPSSLPTSATPTSETPNGNSTSNDNPPIKIPPEGPAVDEPEASEQETSSSPSSAPSSVPSKMTSLGGGDSSSSEECIDVSYECGRIYKGITMHKNVENGDCQTECIYFVSFREALGWTCGPCAT